jgi:hypothetical protein
MMFLEIIFYACITGMVCSLFYLYFLLNSASNICKEIKKDISDMRNIIKDIQ